LSALHSREKSLAEKHVDLEGLRNLTTSTSPYSRKLRIYRSLSIDTNCNAMNLHIFPAAVRTLLRPNSLPFLQQCRSIHLWYAADHAPRLGSQEINNLRRAAPYDDPANIKIDLWTEGTRKNKHKRIGQITLREALADYIKPGWALIPPPLSLEPANRPSDSASYTLVELDTTKAPALRDKVRRGAKEFHFHTKTRKPGHHKNLLEKAFWMLTKDIKVELHVHTKKAGLKDEKSNVSPIAKVQNNQENIHLRPDVIGKALPENSGNIILPQDVGDQVCWVVCAQKMKARRAKQFLERRKGLEKVTAKIYPPRRRMGMPLDMKRGDVKQQLNKEQHGDALAEADERNP